ncbi:hypothetical protein [Glutamicibacter sp. HZAU]|uniref:hypothetical protein n=1 Tax=Glutamicibacter sp. HZAU TaxID=2049891 RepID=UPI000FFC3DAB|nr:hypothetical protein [Glutamicibacter sp. HZAU]RWZ79858.1 hypothetical protein EKH49_15295 [Glutamicibacter sp. HZAU]
MAETDPLGKNWKLWGGILAFIAAVVILGLIFFPRTPPQPEATPTAPAPSVPVETAPPSNSPSASASKPTTGDCPALSTDTSFPNDAPATEWKRHPAGMLLPVSAEHGPAKVDGEFWRCFSHTPSGALYAGISLGFSFTAGGALEAAHESPKRQEIFDRENSIEGSNYPLIEGYRVMNSSDDAASIEYLATEAGQSGSLRIDMVWSDKEHDWRLDVSSGIADWKLVNDTSTFTDWK